MGASGTVFTMDMTALHNVIVQLGIMLVTAAITILPNLNDLGQLKSLDLSPLQQLTKQMNQFVPFCLAYYVALSLSRWWAMRADAVGKVFDAFANVSMLVSCELHEKKWQDLRNQVAKYGIASVELLVQSATGKDNLKELVAMDVLTPAEVEAVARKSHPYQRPMMMWAWIMRICVASLDHNKSPAPIAAKIIKHCCEAREGMAAIEHYLGTQLPFAYVHLITLLVNMQNIIFSILSGVTVAVNLGMQNVAGIIIQIVACFVVVLIYQSLLQITVHVQDPFGDDVLDFPIKSYTTYIATMIDAFFEAQLPCPVVAEDGSLKRPREKRRRKQAPVNLMAQANTEAFLN